MRVIFSFVFIVLAIVLFPLVLAALVLLFQAEVNHSRFFAFGILSLFLAVYFLVKRSLGTVGYPGTWAVAFLVITAGLWGTAFMQSPKGSAKDPQSGFVSVYEDAVFYPRWHPANLVAERDQARMALFLAGYAGMDFDDARSSDSRKALKAAYDQMEYLAADTIEYGTQLPVCYHAWCGKPSSQLHRYVYRPTAEKPSMPVLMLLHGPAGNLKVGPWAFKDLADELGMAIVAPTFGNGEWQGDGGKNRLEKAVQYIRDRPELDESAVILAGYGEGGLGVLLGAKEMPKAFRGFIHISSPLEEATIESMASSGLKELKTLVLHGADDRIARINDAEAAVETLKRWQMPVTFQRFEDEGTMLLFTRTEDVNNRIVTWIRTL